METFSALLALCAGNSPATGEFPARKRVTRSFDIFFDLRLVTPYGSANDLLPDGSKPFPETMLTLVMTLGIQLKAIAL